MTSETIPADIRNLFEELTSLGYTITYLGNGLGHNNRRVVIYGDMYRVDIQCKCREEYQISYKVNNIEALAQDTHVVMDLELDVEILDELRDTLEPALNHFVEWLYDKDAMVVSRCPHTKQIKVVG